MDNIDLKKRLLQITTEELNGSVSFIAQPVSDGNLNELALIAELLERVGVTLQISRKNGENASGLSYDFISLKINEDKYQAVLKRHAGRKANFIEKYEKYGKCTVSELQEKLKTMKKTKIAQELGCSRMTLYRIINNISERTPDGTTSIWHYTS